MKNIKIKNIFILIVMALMFSACEKWIDHDLNKNPDSPENPPMSVILPAAQGRIAYHTGTYDVSGTTGMWMQQIQGAARQAAIIGNYTFVSSDVVNLWNSLYRDATMDLNIIIQKSQTEEEKSPYFEGVAKILLAYDLGLASQLFGDVPYREAWQGIENKHPVYDPQEQLYGDLQTMLDEAITALQADPALNLFDPADGDMIFNGDLNAWIKTAYALKARLAIHLTKRNSNAYQQAIDFINAGGMESNADDCQFNFGLGDTEANPLYQFDEQREDAAQSPLFTTYVTDLNQFVVGTDTLDDPRLTVFQTESDDNGVRTFGSYFGAKDAPIHFITFAEQQFILAEALYGVGNESAAKDTLLAAIRTSLEKFNVFDAAWFAEVTAKISPLSGQALFDEIMNQKYVAMFLQPEAFVDWRRTDIPQLTPVTGTEIPRRFPYSEEERNFNRNIPPVTSIYARNWFDAE